MSTIEIGRLLRSSTAGCVVGCRVSEIAAPLFGGMLRIPVDEEQDYHVIGLIYDIHIDDDGLVRQIITSANVSSEVILDNRLNRNVPVEISVLFIGYTLGKTIFHLIPPRPPLTLDAIYPCGTSEMCGFTSSGRFGYFRHILRAVDLPIGELLAAHIQQAARAQRSAGNLEWAVAAEQELITLLRDDYPTLMSVMSALSDSDIHPKT